MKLSVTSENGKLRVVDHATGKALDWVDAVVIDGDPGGRPILYLGTFSFVTDLTIGKSPAPAAPAP